MRYCAHFYRGCTILNKVSEIMLVYDHKTVNIIDYVKENYLDEQRIILDSQLFLEKDIVDIYKALHKTHPNMAIMCHYMDDYKLLQEKEIPYFFSHICTTFDDLAALITMGVSDVYIGGDLCFNLKDASKICKEYGVIVRAYPNIVQSTSGLPGLDPIKKFFIRPEDVDFYSDYIDVLEFVGLLTKQPVYYKIYSRLKEWKFDLDLLIIDFDEKEINNKAVIPGFAKMRLDCGKRCGYGRCNYCDRVRDLNKTLDKAGLIIKESKDESETMEEIIQDDYTPVETSYNDDTSRKRLL